MVNIRCIRTLATCKLDLYYLKEKRAVQTDRLDAGLALLMKQYVTKTENTTNATLQRDQYWCSGRI